MQRISSGIRISDDGRDGEIEGSLVLDTEVCTFVDPFVLADFPIYVYPKFLRLAAVESKLSEGNKERDEGYGTEQFSATFPSCVKQRGPRLLQCLESFFYYPATPKWSCRIFAPGGSLIPTPISRISGHSHSSVMARHRLIPTPRVRC